MSGRLTFLKMLLLLHYTTFTGPIMMMLVPTVTSSTAIRSSPSSLEYNLLPLQSSSSLLSLSDLLNGGGAGGVGGSRFAVDANTNINNNSPVESILETLMEGGAKVMLFVPPRDNFIEKRDPPDVGTGRSHSGNKAVNTLRGQSASYDPVGPGRRKRWRKKRSAAPVAEGEGQQY